MNGIENRIPIKKYLKEYQLIRDHANNLKSESLTIVFITRGSKTNTRIKITRTPMKNRAFLIRSVRIILTNFY